LSSATGRPRSRRVLAWEIAVRIEKILCTVLHEAHEWQVEVTMQTLSEGSEGFYKSYLD